MDVKVLGEEIVAIRYGLAEETNRLIKVIALSGTYSPLRGNVIIGKIENINFSGWNVDLGAPDNAFLPLQEVPRYVNKDSMHEVFDIGEMLVAKIVGIAGRGIDLTIKSRGLGKIDEGLIMEINSNKVPRVIGKEGSMINLIKNESGCNITVGQDGLIWIKGDNIENELLVKKAIIFVTENSISSGLTEEVENWFKQEKGK